jgi:succinate dehydrogenase / fumarate reductase, cytochrome b subunit
VATGEQVAFFSYSRNDSEFAIRLARDLKMAGAAVWLDQLDIQPGMPWDREVEKALANCPGMLVILSPSSVKSENVRDEVSFALSKQKRVIPVLCRDCEVPFRLARLQHIDFRTDYGHGLQTLLKTLGVKQPAVDLARVGEERGPAAKQAQRQQEPRRLAVHGERQEATRFSRTWAGDPQDRWRKLHSISGIFPVGAFLLLHFIANSQAIYGPQAYNDQAKFLAWPFVQVMEWVFIFIPLLYHALYGIYIWYRGELNGREYPWTGDWLYTSQRWTGIIAFVFILYHVIHMRVMSPELAGPNGEYKNAFWKVFNDFESPLPIVFYVIGIVATSWHFAYGVWLFAANWGLTIGAKARRNFGFVCFGLAIILVGIGLWTVYAFINSPPGNIPHSTVQY